MRQLFDDFNEGVNDEKEFYLDYQCNHDGYIVQFTVINGCLFLIMIAAREFSRKAVEFKCRQLLKNIAEAKNSVNQKVRLQELCKHLFNSPDSICGYTERQIGLSELLRIKEKSSDPKVQSYARQALTMMGYTSPPRGKGISILSIDGGGTKGVVVLEILRELERLTGKQVYQLFDLICGVSTGAILVMLLGAFQTSIDKCSLIYKETSAQMFQRDLLRGTSRLLWTHAYYDTAAWEKILQTVYTDTLMIETAQNPAIPKIATISALMNTSTIQPFVFRNYNHSDKSLSYYEGSCKYRVWQAIRASAAAPGFFEEFLLDSYVHQDGGILVNNPTPIAIHEAQLLWPNTPIQTCISIGSGRYSPMSLKVEEKAALTSLRTKITRFIDSATDTECSHRLLQDLLVPGTYYRFNPTLSEHMRLDECRIEKLEQMQTDAQMYIRKNEYKLNKAAKSLSQTRSSTQIFMDKIKTNLKMYSFA